MFRIIIIVVVIIIIIIIIVIIRTSFLLANYNSSLCIQSIPG